MRWIGNAIQQLQHHVLGDTGEVPATVEGTADAGKLFFIRSLRSRTDNAPVRLGNPREFTTEGTDRFKQLQQLSTTFAVYDRSRPHSMV